MAERRLNWLTSNKSALEFGDKLRAQMPAGTRGGSPADSLSVWQADAVGLGKCCAQEADTPGELHCRDCRETGRRLADAVVKAEG